MGSGKELLTGNLCVLFSWTNSEFEVPITLGNCFLKPPSSPVDFSFDVSYNGFVPFVYAPHGNCTYGGTNESAIVACT